MAKKVLFVCTNNSARSQMAAGLMRHMGGDTGSHPTRIQTMDTLAIDIRGQTFERTARAIEASDGMPHEFADMLRVGKG
ncbi:MAG: hypothetical protein SGI73_12735 [Chloroflexota bacterium]|nr:hypothetical protein [Chloroflexota bacterium]